MIAQMTRTKDPAAEAKQLLGALDRREEIRSRGIGAVIEDDVRAWAAEMGIPIQRHDKPVVV